MQLFFTKLLTKSTNDLFVLFGVIRSLRVDIVWSSELSLDLCFECIECFDSFDSGFEFNEISFANRWLEYCYHL